MPDDEIRNLIPGNNPNGPSVTPFANRDGQGSPPLASYDQPLSGGMNLDAATEWATHGDNVSATRWIATVVFGRVKLDIPGKNYSRRLSYVRWSLCLIPLYLAALLGLFVWAVS